MTDTLAGRARPVGIGGALILLTLLLTQFVIPGTGDERGVPLAVLFQGLVQGMIAAVIAAGLVLLFRTSRIINFGALAFGIPGALLSFQLILFTPVPFPISVLAGLVLSAAFGAVAELTFGRRFAKRSRLIFTIATIFIATFLIQVVTPAVVNAPFLPPIEERPPNALFAENAFEGLLPLSGFTFRIGGFPVPFGFPEVFAIELALVTLVALGLILRYSRLGVALRSVADNSERAAMLGISTGGITTAAWAIAGVLGGVAVLLYGINGRAGVTNGPESTVALLLPLTAAVLARFRSLPVATLACVLLAVLESSMRFAVGNAAAYVTGGQLLLLVGGLLLQRRDLFRLASSGEGSWRLTAEERPVPREMAALPGYRALRYVFGGVALVVLAVLPFVSNAGVVSRAQYISLLGIVALSLVVLTGWAGQVSFGQFALVAVGAVVAGGAADRAELPFLLAVPLGVAVAAGVAVLVGLPALRVKGLFLGVATFALAVATAQLLFDQKLFGWLLPTAIPRPNVFVDFDGETPFYYLCVASFLGTLLFVRNLRASRFGRLLIASRDNDAALQSAGVSIVKTRLQAFAISGAIAGFGGALLAFQLRTVSAAAFDPQLSLQLFIFVVLGGVTSIAGALIGVAYFGYTSFYLPNGPVFAYIASTLPILILFFAPGGLLAVFTSFRDAMLRIVAQRRGMIVPALFRGQDAAVMASRLTPMADPLPSAGLAALPPDARWTLDSRMHGQAGRNLSEDEAIDEAELFAAAAAAVESDDEVVSNRGDQNGQTDLTTSATDLVGTTGARR